MGWSRAGAAMAKRLVETLAQEPIALIVHSDVIRTRRLAQAVARRTASRVVADPRWQERDFGSWEGRSWDAIWRETGNLMDEMVRNPSGFHPGGGETTLDVWQRAQAACASLPTKGETLVIAHGGTIAAVRAISERRPIEDVASFIPSPGELTYLPDAKELNATMIGRA